MPTPQEVMADPAFLGLGDMEKAKVLDRVDPNFQKLPPPEREKVIGRLRAVPSTVVPVPDTAAPISAAEPESSSVRTALTHAMRGVQIGTASLAEGLTSVAG